MKRKLSLILALVLLLSALFSVNVFAKSNIIINGVDIGYAAGDYFSKNGKACACHNQNKCVPEKRGCNCKHVAGTAQCYAFALWCENKLWGYNDVSSPKKFQNIGSVSAGKLTTSKIKELIEKAPIGSHIRTNGSNHSMILISKNSNGFTVAQANGSNNNEFKSWSACRIGTATYTWLSYVKSTYGNRGIKFIKAPFSVPNPEPTNETKKTYSDWKTPTKCYSTSTSNNITVYQTSTSTAKYGTVYGLSDELIIKDWTDKRVKVTYPTSSGQKTGWIDKKYVSSVTPGKVVKTYTAKTKITTYKRQNGASYGYISKGDKVYSIATKGNWMQVIYPVSGGYKMGWIEK
ncbi:MAG: hypothetical protein IJN96_02005 [Clostridia bacterium]|nr:hypothetical protein [Clostridia bacterium]